MSFSHYNVYSTIGLTCPTMSACSKTCTALFADKIHNMTLYGTTSFGHIADSPDLRV